jgi:hypothetical protein
MIRRFGPLAALVLFASLQLGCPRIASTVLGGPWQFFCDEPHKSGEKCNSNEECDAGLYCASATGTCAPRLALGKNCKVNTDCATGLACAIGAAQGVCYTLSCDAKGNCTRGAQTANVCTSTGTDCPTGELCSLTETGAGTCVDAPGLAQSCDPYMGPEDACEAGLSCQFRTLVCTAPPGKGDPCPMNSRCPGALVCRADLDSPVCDDPVPLGGRCAVSRICGRGAHCDLAKLTCVKDEGAGANCPNGNECGEGDFVEHGGLDCVQGVCTVSKVVGDKCYPYQVPRCNVGLVCAKAQ